MVKQGKLTPKKGMAIVVENRLQVLTKVGKTMDDNGQWLLHTRAFQWREQGHLERQIVVESDRRLLESEARDKMARVDVDKVKTRSPVERQSAKMQIGEAWEKPEASWEVREKKQKLWDQRRLRLVCYLILRAGLWFEGASAGQQRKRRAKHMRSRTLSSDAQTRVRPYPLEGVGCPRHKLPCHFWP